MFGAPFYVRTFYPGAFFPPAPDELSPVVVVVVRGHGGLSFAASRGIVVRPSEPAPVMAAASGELEARGVDGELVIDGTVGYTSVRATSGALPVPASKPGR